MDQAIRIGTRGSPLALVQAEEVRRRLAVAMPALGEPDAIMIVPIRTTGVRNLELSLSEIGGKGLFTKELEDGLMAGTLDIAVHSMKDMPTALPSRLDCSTASARGRSRCFAGAPWSCDDSDKPGDFALLRGGRYIQSAPAVAAASVAA